MGRVLDAFSWLVTVRPRATLVVLAVITILLAAGVTQRSTPADTQSFLADDSAVAAALVKIDTSLFGDSAQDVSVTLLFRGQVLTPAGLAQIDGVIERVRSDPRVADVLAAGDVVIAPTHILAAVLGHDDFANTTQGSIDEALDRIRSDPEFSGARAALDALTGTDADGSSVAVATVRLSGAGDWERLIEAELAIQEIAEETEGPLAGSSLSPATINQESAAATGASMSMLMGLALVVIAAVTFLFTRSVSDVLLTVVSLIITIVWILGAQGWLGPNALGLIGPPNSLTRMVPLVLIGLAVDYAIQTIALYLEQRNSGQAVAIAVRAGLRRAIIPLSLAAVTTMAGFFTNLVSPIPANGDFGVTAGLGVGFGLIVMLTLIPSARTLIDRRQESHGALPAARPIANALPGVGAAAAALGRELARRPAPYLGLVGIVTVVLGVAAAQIESSFDARDLRPSGGDTQQQP